MMIFHCEARTNLFDCKAKFFWSYFQLSVSIFLNLPAFQALEDLKRIFTSIWAISLFLLNKRYRQRIPVFFPVRCFYGSVNYQEEFRNFQTNQYENGD
jgi:hypothetical protein